MMSYTTLLQRYENLKKQHKKIVDENLKLHFENKELLKKINKLKNNSK